MPDTDMVNVEKYAEALHGVRVIDAITGPTESIGRFLAELGADVIRLEPTTGAASRRSGYLIDGTSVTFATRNLNKRGVALDLDTENGRENFEALLASAELFLDSRAPGELAALGYTPERLEQLNPRLVTLAVTDFGQVGPRRDWAASSDVLFALSGVLSRSGLPEIAEPLLPPRHLAYESASMQAVWAALLAFTHAQNTGVGDYVDFSVLDALIHLLDPGYGIGGSARAGAPMRDLPRNRPDARHLYPTFSAADGAVRICVLSPRQWQSMLDWLGHPAELDGDRYTDIMTRQAADGVIKPYYERLFAGMTRAEAVEHGRHYGVPVAGLLTATEVLAEPAYAAAHSFIEQQLAPGLVSTVPTGLVEIDGTKFGIRRPAPELGEHTEEVLSSLPTPQAVTHRGLSKMRPFEGLRVLDLGVIVVGAEVGRLFADYGADVVKVESAEFPDGSRQAYGGQVITEGFCWGHRNKRSLGLNLKSAEGIELFKSLVAQSDVVLTNFKPGTLEKLGLGYEQLAQINPRIIVSESSAFGNHGPWSSRMGYGPLVRASSGLSLTWQYPEVDFSFSDTITIYPDHVAARVSASAVVALLHRRERTGLGGHISSAQIDVIFSSMADGLAAERLREGSIRAEGNRRGVDAPTGPFPAAGDDEWVVVDVRSDDEFAALAGVLGRSDWQADPELATTAGRLARSAELELALGEWTRLHSPVEIENLLQQAGIPAGRMVRVPDFERDDHSLARGLLGRLEQPQFDGGLPAFLAEARFASGLTPLLRPAPLQGEHSREIVRERFGFDDARIDALIESNVLQVARSAVPAASRS